MTRLGNTNTLVGCWVATIPFQSIAQCLTLQPPGCHHPRIKARNWPSFTLIFNVEKHGKPTKTPMILTDVPRFSQMGLSENRVPNAVECCFSRWKKWLFWNVTSPSSNTLKYQYRWLAISHCVHRNDSFYTTVPPFLSFLTVLPSYHYDINPGFINP